MRQYFNSSILFCVSIFLLTSCWGPQKKSKDEIAKENGASFFVYEVTGDAREKKDVDTVWKVPRSKDYSFKACVKDNHTKEPIHHQNFEVAKGNKVYTAKATDKKGCFTWVENLPFNFFAENPTYVYEKRFVRSKNNHAGQYPIKIIVNPWLSYRGGSRSDEVIYLNEGSASEEDMANLVSEQNLMGKSSEKVDLWMKDVVAHIRDRGETVSTSFDSEGLDSTGVDIEINLEMSPLIKLYDQAGTPIPVELKAGQFRVEAHLIATNFDKTRSKKLLLTPEVTPTVGDIHWSEGILRVPIKSRISRKVSRGQIELAIRVIPINTPSNVNISNFDGLYLLVNRFDKIDGKNKPTLRPDIYREGSKFNFVKYLKEAEGFAQYKASKEAQQNEPYMFKTLSVRFQTIKPGETATTRTVLFRVEACILDQYGSPVPNEEFEVKIIRNSKLNSDKLMRQPEAKEPIRGFTREDGCLPWMDEIKHKYYMPEDYVFPEAIITNISHKQRAEKLGKKPFSKRLTMVVNPWDEKWTFGADKRSLLEDYVASVKERKKVASRFFVYEYSYQTIRFLYEIDKFMNLEVKKTVLLKLYPKALRYSSIVYGRRATETLRDGIYLMKVALQKHYLDPASKGVKIVKKRNGSHGYLPTNLNAEVDPKADDNAIYSSKIGSQVKVKEHISVVQKLVRVQDGHIITPITFAIKDLRLMKIRSQFLVQLETIDEEKLLNANVFNKIANEKIKNLSNSLEDGHLTVDEQSQCLLQKSDNFKLELETILQGLKKQREEEAKVDIDMKAEVREKLLSYKVNLLNQLVRILKTEELNRSEYSDDRSKLLKRQKELQTEGKTLENQVSDKAYAPLNMCNDITDAIDEQLKLNDFTVNPAAPILNLNLLIDHASGLDGRTFVGPLTLIHNDNHSHMRATDNLDEVHCESDDCNQLDFSKKDVDNSVYEDSELFGSMKYLGEEYKPFGSNGPKGVQEVQGMTVDRLIQKKLKMVKVYEKAMTVESLLYNFLKFTKTKYTSLSDDPKMKIKKYTCGPMDFKTLNKTNVKSECLEETDEYTIPKAKLIESLNSSKGKTIVSKFNNKKVEEADLEEIVESGKMTKALMEKFCDVLADQFVEVNEVSLKKRNWYDNIKSLHGNLIHECRSTVKYEDEMPIDIFKKYRVKETGRYKFKGGKSININVGDTFTVNHSSVFDFGGTFGQVPVLGPVLSKYINLGWSRRESVSESDNTSISKQTFLVMQTAALDVELLKYEKCVSINWNPSFYEFNHSLDRIYKRIKAEVESEKRVKNPVYMPGLFLCSGKIESQKPVAVRERYYYFTQHFTDGDMLDPGDLYNHPWLLALRGVRDFRAFIDLASDQKDVIPTINETERFRSNPFASDKVQESYKWPIDQLSETYKKVLPSFPGIYTVIPEEKETVIDYPWNDNVDDAFVDDTFENSWDLVPNIKPNKKTN